MHLRMGTGMATAREGYAHQHATARRVTIGPSQNNGGRTCAQNEEDYGCDCSGCACLLDTTPVPSVTPAPSPPASFEVESGDCTVWGACFYSPGFPNDYGNDQSCAISVLAGGVLMVESFELEDHWLVRLRCSQYRRGKLLRGDRPRRCCCHRRIDGHFQQRRRRCG